MLIDLYETAYLNDIIVYNLDMNDVKAASLMDDEGDCFIALNTKTLENEKDEVLRLAHDLGHCMTGSFYNRYSHLNNIRQKEYRADKWAVHKLLPYYKLLEAFEEGVIERWELADYFDVTEDFISKAIEVYENEGKLFKAAK